MNRDIVWNEVRENWIEPKITALKKSGHKRKIPTEEILPRNIGEIFFSLLNHFFLADDFVLNQTLC